MSGLRGLPMEKKLVFGGVLLSVLLIVATAVLVPAQDEDDPRPSTTNAGPAGAKAAFVLLGRLGYRVRRFEKPVAEIGELDAPHTTLVLASPWGAASKLDQDALNGFLERGGRVVADSIYGGAILPGLYWHNGDEPPPAAPRCTTSPEGTGPLAEIGSIHMPVDLLARDDIPETYVSQECPGGAAVIAYRYGAGTAVWWASVEPITNRGLHDAAKLKLVLASIGPLDRSVVFEEDIDSGYPKSPWAQTHGLPVLAMVLQLLLAALFLVLAFGRRHGPLRLLRGTPRTSPLEFAHSLGGLYHRAGAGEAAVAEARTRLFTMMERQCGVSRESLLGSPEHLAEELRARFGWDEPGFASLLRATAGAERVTSARALALVQQLHMAAEALRSLSGAAGASPVSPSNHRSSGVFRV